MPRDIPVIDLLVTLPRPEAEHPAGYMFKDTPQVAADGLLPEMDRFGVELALIPVVRDEPTAPGLLTSRPDRFLGCWQLEPDRGMAGVRDLRRAADELGVVAAGAFPAGTTPQVGIDDRSWYPLYATCAELGIPVFINIGVPGPRWPAHVQHPMLLEPVLADFPELTVVTRHGGEPWVAETIALLRSWPNLHYSTSAFAPRYYPAEIIDFANRDGADRVLYAGYFPSGLSLERIFAELAQVPLADDVWPKFLRTNALRVLGRTEG
ncbi:MAG: amidohydrolase 2 [Actinomycetia bacterium]|nr:amidohydrolase 2 [Actinomycetes bacterium]